MKTRVFCRLGKGKNGIKSDANAHRPNAAPLTERVGGQEKFIPTVNFTLVLDVPDSVFDLSRIKLEAVVPEDLISIAADVEVA